MIQAVVCHIRHGGRILLQRKSQGRFGEGKWNGPGGKVKPGETPEACSIREVREETGLEVTELEYHGELRFYFGGEQVDWLVHVLSTRKFSGILTPNEEGELRWFSEEEIPLNQMWEDDYHWLYLMLNGKHFTGDFHYTKDGSRITKLSLTVE